MEIIFFRSEASPISISSTEIPNLQSIRDKKFKRGEGEEKRRECRSRAASVRLDTTGLTQASQVVASVIITDREF